MLKRGDSDFQWFKARTDSLHSSLTSEYTEMAASTVPLNAETSQPQERAEHDLPPKSYADAVINKTSETGERADANDARNSGANGHLESHTRSSTAGNVNSFPPVNNDIPKPANSENDDQEKVYEKRSGEENGGKDKVVYEKYVNNGGDHLTSIKEHGSYEKHLEHDRETAPQEKKKAKETEIAKKQDERPHLASGRRAGAGWERSA
jgi:2-acylglycerol O-acyltransferase 2